MIKDSSIYIGKVIHKRFKPKIHFFKYKIFSMLIDLSEIDLLNKSLKIFSYNKFNIVSFYDVDHGPRDGTSLKQWVIKNLIDNQINTEEIKIKLLCYPRILGYVFNPLSVFFIYNKKSELISILYEVKNTFGEQHTYIFKTNESDNLIKNTCKKLKMIQGTISSEVSFSGLTTGPDHIVHKNKIITGLSNIPKKGERYLIQWVLLVCI